MTVAPKRLLAGIVVPDTPIVQHAFAQARQVSEFYLFNHVVRSWLFATRIGQLRNIDYDAEVLAVGTLLHDIGLAAGAAGARRFEVEGADTARDFAITNGFDRRRAQLVWDSVALNSTPSIGLHKEAEVALSTAGIGLDFGGRDFAMIHKAEMQIILDEFPRLDMKRRFTDCVCCIARTKPELTYGSFIQDFGERFIPGYKAPSVVDFLMTSPFDE